MKHGLLILFFAMTGVIVAQADDCVIPDPPVTLENQFFCGAATVGDLMVDLAADAETGTRLVWYNIANDRLDLITGLEDGATYYVRAEIGACKSVPVYVEVMLNLSEKLFPPQASTPQIFCTGAIIEDLQAAGVDVKWYATETEGIVLDGNTELTDNTIYYASQSVGGCESTMRTAVEVNIYNYLLPPVPWPSPQVFCGPVNLPGQLGQFRVIWYYGEQQVTVASITGIYYGALISPVCGELPTRMALQIIINDIPSVPEVVSPQWFCDGATVADLIVSGVNIVWYDVASGGTPLPFETLLTTDTYYAAQIGGACEITDRTSVEVTVSSCRPTGNRDLPGNISFNLYPNPATYEAKLVAGGLTGDVTITITDMLGYVLKIMQEKMAGGQIETTIDVSTFEKGIYFVKIQNGSLNRSQKLIVK